MNPYQLIFYQTTKGKVRCQRWLQGLKDVKGVAKIQTRLNRLSLGYRGDSKPLRNGVKELRVDYGPGYRVYFAEIKTPSEIKILLLGGTKKTQKQDIEKAVAYWECYKKRFKHE